MVCLASRGNAKKLLRTGSRIAGRLASDWYAVYVETPKQINPADQTALLENIKLAEELGGKVVKLKSRRVANALIDFARREGITYVVFVQSSRLRLAILMRRSEIN